MLVTRSIGNDATESLVKPAADTVETVVETAAISIPVLPGPSRPVIDHVQVPRVSPLLEKAVEPVTFLCLCGPLGDDRHSDKTGLEMAVIDYGRTLKEFVADLSRNEI